MSSLNIHAAKFDILSFQTIQWATVVDQNDAIDLYSLYKGGYIWDIS